MPTLTVPVPVALAVMVTVPEGDEAADAEVVALGSVPVFDWVPCGATDVGTTALDGVEGDESPLASTDLTVKE